ncbi:hypothetical protein [Sorangium sp. So ce887]|uniref:hypothetical protein n=1 Tax=Sorangium sp. So ce887 TaxID=3133324 RepID=UPI003F6153FB
MHQKQLDLDEALPKEFTRRLARCGECGARDADWKAAFASLGDAGFRAAAEPRRAPWRGLFRDLELGFSFRGTEERH